MQKTKKELVSEILRYEDVTDTQANLMKKTIKELEQELSNLINAKTNDESKDLQIDKESLMEQMKAELMEQLREEARREVEAETIVDSDKPKRKKEIDRFEPIPVMNVTKWGLVYSSTKSGSEWNWSKFGDIEYIEFSELLTMRSSQRTFIDEPFILILDDDVVDYMGLTKMYDAFDKEQVKSLDGVFRLKPDEFIETIETLPRGIQHSVVARARELYDNGDLDSRRKVDYINERFKTDIGLRG